MKLLIYTQEKTEFDYIFTSFIFKAKDGEIEIQPNHTNLMTEIDICVGEIALKVGHTKKIILTGGFCIVKDKEVKVLARTVEFPEILDKKRAIKAKERAEERLKKVEKDPEINIIRAEAALQRAAARLSSLD